MADALPGQAIRIIFVALIIKSARYSNTLKGCRPKALIEHHSFHNHLCLAHCWLQQQLISLLASVVRLDAGLSCLLTYSVDSGEDLQVTCMTT